jgi:psiF repeat
MKLAATLTAIALIGSASAFAADAPAGSATAPAAAPAKHMSLKACNKQADGKKLTGDERAKFVKDCRAGKSAS